MHFMDVIRKDVASINKPWLKSYPADVPAEINPDHYQSLVDVFLESCRQHAARDAFFSMGKTITYQEIEQYTRDFAAYLQHDLKLKKGDRIAIMLPNILQYPIALFGALRAGLVVVNVNPLYTVNELAYQINNSGAETIVVLANFAKTVEKAFSLTPNLRHVIITHLGDMLPSIKSIMLKLMLKYVYKATPSYHLPEAVTFKNALKIGSMRKHNPVEIHAHDIAFLQYTGGTTGISKGAVLTHRNIIANLMQADAWLNSLLVTSQQKEIIITALPLYHIFSLTANLMYFFKIGARNVLIANPRDTKRMIKVMSQFKFTAITGVNTLFNTMIKTPSFLKLDFSELRLTLGGGMAVQRAVAEKWQAITGAPLLEAYGLTETSPCVAINPVMLRAYNGSIGLPVSSTSVAILSDDGEELPIGEQGEIAVKGPQVMSGYWNNPIETLRVFSKDGWLLTGDIGKMDENGFIWLLERKKDMILVSGFNVYPNEVEGVIVRMNGVRECAVIGIPDESSGEIVKAVVVKDDPNLTENDIRNYCREYLTAYKVPKIIEFRDELPKSNIGKILRRTLKSFYKN